MVFLPAGRDTWKLKVPTSRMDGNRRVTVKRTTNTKDKRLALAMSALIEELADTFRAWDVLDPFAGSGTTLSVATGNGRLAVGCELNPAYAALAVDRIGPMLTDLFTLAGAA